MTTRQPKPYEAIHSGLAALLPRVHAFVDSHEAEEILGELRLLTRATEAWASALHVDEIAIQRELAAWHQTPAPVCAPRDAQREPPQSDPPMMSAECDTRNGYLP